MCDYALFVQYRVFSGGVYQSESDYLTILKKYASVRNIEMLIRRPKLAKECFDISSRNVCCKKKFQLTFRPFLHPFLEYEARPQKEIVCGVSLSR